MKHKIFGILSALIVLTVVGFTASTAFANPAANAPESALAQTNITYVVRYGDTLNKIAARYCTTWQAIYALNYTQIGSDPNHIFPGMVLTVPANCNAGTTPPPIPPSPTPSTGVVDRGPMVHASGTFNSPYYAVAYGDWLSYIGYRFNVPWQNIYAANHLYTTTIYAGQVLLIPGSGNVPPPAPSPTPVPGGVERVNFSYGTYSAMRTGTIANAVPKTYVLGARAGQTMYISGASHAEALNISITNAYGQQVSVGGTNGAVNYNTSAYLPWTGDYFVTFAPKTQPANSSLVFDATFTIP